MHLHRLLTISLIVLLQGIVPSRSWSITPRDLEVAWSKVRSRLNVLKITGRTKVQVANRPGEQKHEPGSEYSTDFELLSGDTRHTKIVERGPFFIERELSQPSSIRVTSITPEQIANHLSATTRSGLFVNEFSIFPTVQPSSLTVEPGGVLLQIYRWSDEPSRSNHSVSDLRFVGSINVNGTETLRFERNLPNDRYVLTTMANESYLPIRLQMERRLSPDKPWWTSRDLELQYDGEIEPGIPKLKSWKSLSKNASRGPITSVIADITGIDVLPGNKPVDYGMGIPNGAKVNDYVSNQFFIMNRIGERRPFDTQANLTTREMSDLVKAEIEKRDGTSIVYFVAPGLLVCLLGATLLYFWRRKSR